MIVPGYWHNHLRGGMVAGHDDLVAAAVAQTGLDDFGDESYREGLEILVRSLRREVASIRWCKRSRA
jgi:hypothetical protein